MSGFFTGYVLPTGIIVAEILAIIVPLLLVVAYYTYAERKVLAYSQLRKGPNVVGPFGLLQPIADGLKMLVKETVIPSGANRVVFIAAPMVTLTLALVAWAVIPFDYGVVVRTSMSASSICSRSAPCRSTASSWPAGRRIRAMPFSARCARRRRWCPTRSRSASCW